MRTALGTRASLSFLAVAALLVFSPDARACSACFGASDAPMVQGMAWGIVFLLAVIGSVLGGVTAFFVHIGRKSSETTRKDPSLKSSETDLKL
jgi:hypothetical protein